MAHGAPDDSNVMKFGGVNRLDDLGELAARLGSPVMYHRLGDVVFIDDFEYGLNSWETFGTNSDRFCRTSNEASLSRGASCILNSGTGGFLPIYIQNHFASVMGKRLGFYVAISLRANVGTFGMNLHVYSRTEQMSYMWQWRKSTRELTCRTTGGGFHSIDSDVGLYENPTLYHHFKLVIDQQTQMYRGLYLNDVYYDLSSVPGWITTPGREKHIITNVLNSGDGTLASEIALDNFVITTNEW